MRTFFSLALLAVVATMASATVQLDPIGQYQPQQPFPQPHQPFPQEQQPFPQPQLPFPRPQLPFPQPQPPFPQPQQPFPQPQQPFPQPPQPFPQPQQPYPQPQQPFPQAEQPFPQPQQPFPQPQQPFTHEPQKFPKQRQPSWHQQPFFQPIVQQQQLNQCREFLVHQCKPVVMVSLLRSWLLQQSSCHVRQQQCCRQLALIPRQHRYPAIHSMVHDIIMQQQKQFTHPEQQQVGQGFFQPQPQHVGQGFIRPQHLAQFEAMRTHALQTLPVMCNVQVPLYYSTAPFGGNGGF